MLRVGGSVAALVAALLMGQFGPGTRAAREAKQQALRQEVIDADSPRKAGEAFEKYFKHVSPDNPIQLSALKTDENTNIALQAAWHLNLVSTPNWSKNATRRYFLKSGDAQRFFGFLEGRTGLTIPEWWQTDSSFPDERSLTDSQHQDAIKPLPANYPWQFSLVSHVRFEKVNAGLKLETNGLSIVVPGDLLTKFEEDAGFEGLHYCKVRGHGDAVFLAFFDTVGDSGPLVCIDAKKNEVRWTSKMWALGRPVDGLRGGCVTRIELEYDKRQPKNIIVWGASWNAKVHGNYVEAFDIETGKTDFRFSTNYWHAWNGE